MVPTLARASAKSFTEREKRPGVYLRWSTNESDKELKRVWVSGKAGGLKRLEIGV